ncbi:putative protein phosphatase 2C 32 [Diplonema papillatum]|nr:putative protein phosphatase 2C 32 [Diplonema papillatum]
MVDVPVPMYIKSGYTLNAAYSNEDRVVVCEDEADWRVYAVLDGHGGKQAVNLISSNLSELLLDAVRTVQDTLLDEAPELWKLDVEREIIARYERLEHLVLTSTFDHSGACVTAVLVSCTTPICLIVHLGDCRVLHLTKESADPLTQDHQLSNPDERSRVLASGHMPIGGRVAGLEPTRTIGDADVKAVAPDAVSWVPEIILVDFGASGHAPPELDEAGDTSRKGKRRKRVAKKAAEGTATYDMLVLASDGVWGSASHQCVATAANRALFKKAAANPSAAAVAVSQAARNKGSTDDISCIVVFMESR